LATDGGRSSADKALAALIPGDCAAMYALVGRGNVKGPAMDPKDVFRWWWAAKRGEDVHPDLRGYQVGLRYERGRPSLGVRYLTVRALPGIEETDPVGILELSVRPTDGLFDVHAEQEGNQTTLKVRRVENGQVIDSSPNTPEEHQLMRLVSRVVEDWWREGARG
jgi:hypothetical protein